MEQELLFVYGTLKQGERNNALMQGKFLREVCTEPQYRLIDLGTFPALTNGDKAIQGELWEVDKETLERLDDFEGVHQGMYARRLICLEDGSQAYAYLWAAFLCNFETRAYEGTNWYGRKRECQTVSQSFLPSSRHE